MSRVLNSPLSHFALLLALGFTSAAGCASQAKCGGGASTAPTAVEPAATEPAEAPIAPEADEADAAVAPPTVIIFVRHAEKQSDGTRDPALTERGERRAECLGRLLKPFEADHLFSSPYARTRATIAPLAAASGLEPKVVDAGDLATWTSTLQGLPAGSRAVVAGHSNTIPALVGALGSSLSGLDDKGNIPDDDYDRMVQVSIDGQGRVHSSYTLAYCTEPPAS